MSVAYSATGAGGGGAGTSFSFNHTPSNSGEYVILGISTDRACTLSNVECAGTAMTSLGSMYGDDNSAVGAVALYGLATTGTSALAITGTLSTTANYIANTVGYTGVSSVGSATTNYGNSTSLSSGSITVTTGQMAVAAMGGNYYFYAATLGSLTGGTNRVNANESSDTSIAISDSTSTATFGATASASTWWSSVAVVLSPPSGTTVTPTTASVAISGGTSTITDSGNGIYNPTTATVAITGGTPQVLAPFVAAPTTATVKITGGNPSPFSTVLQKLANGDNVNIQVMGDSTANGYGDTLAGGWTARLALILGTYFDVTVYEVSYGSNSYESPVKLYTGSGSNTIYMYDAGIDGSSLSGEETWITDYGLLAEDDSYPAPDVVMIYDGYNDIGFTSDWISASTWISDVQNYLTNYMFPNFPSTPIVYCTQHTSFSVNQPYWYADQSAVAAMLTGNSLPLTPALQPSTNATYPDVWVLDTQQALNGYTSAQVISSADGDPHLTGTGYQILADWMATQLAPSVTFSGGTVSPITATVAITGSTAAVSIGSSYAASPTTATVAITGGTPVVSDNYTAVPTTATVAITGGTPSLTGSVTATPTTATVHITGDTPSVLAPFVASPTTATVAISGDTSSITLRTIITPTTAAVAISTGTSAITGYTYLAAPASATVAISGGTPAISVASLTLITPPQRIYQVQPSSRIVQVNLHSRYVQVPPNA